MREWERESERDRGIDRGRREGMREWEDGRRREGGRGQRDRERGGR